MYYIIKTGSLSIDFLLATVYPPADNCKQNLKRIIWAIKYAPPPEYLICKD